MGKDTHQMPTVLGLAWEPAIASMAAKKAASMAFWDSPTLTRGIISLVCHIWQSSSIFLLVVRRCSRMSEPKVRSPPAAPPARSLACLDEIVLEALSWA
jgi:hypothetical protein